MQKSAMSTDKTDFISSNISIFLEIKNYTQRHFSVMIGAEPYNVSRWINGNSKPARRYREKIAKVMGVTVYRLSHENLKDIFLTNENTKTIDKSVIFEEDKSNYAKATREDKAILQESFNFTIVTIPKIPMNDGKPELDNEKYLSELEGLPVAQATILKAKKNKVIGFPIKDNAMSSEFHKGDYVGCMEISKPFWFEYIGKAVVVQLADKTFICRNLSSLKDRQLTLSPILTSQHDNVEVEIKNIQSLWAVVMMSRDYN